MLITGATGFLGRHIQQALSDAGQPLRLLVRPGSRHRHLALPGSEVVEAALDDVAGVADALAGVKAVVYCAGTVRGSRLADFLPANVAGVESVLRATREQCATVPFLLISSLAAGRPDLSDYANSKYLGEQAVRRYLAMNWSILRPPAVYGPGDREMLPVLKMARRGLVVAPGAADQRLSLLHASDAASAVRAWQENWQTCRGQTFEIGDGRAGGHSWRDIVSAAGGRRLHHLRLPATLLDTVSRINVVQCRMTGRAPMLTPGKVRELTQPSWICDNTAFTAATGWKPRIDLASGIRHTLADRA